MHRKLSKNQPKGTESQDSTERSANPYIPKQSILFNEEVRRQKKRCTYAKGVKCDPNQHNPEFATKP